MANKVSFLYIARNKFTAVTDKISRSVDKTKNKFKKLGNQTERTSKQMNRSRIAMGKMGKAMPMLGNKLKGLLVGFAALAGITKSIRIGADFQDSLADLSAITGATGKDLDKLKNKTMQMAIASVTSQTDVAQAIKLVASAKPDLLKNIDALTETTKQVLLLKNAAGIDLASAANITAQGLNIFGAKASEAGKFVNVLAAGAKLGSSEIAETGEAMLIAGPAARAAGLDFVQLNAIIQTTAKGGIKASRAGTAINAILGRLRRQGHDFKKLGLQGVFEEVAEKLKKIKDPTKRAQAESKIFGEEHSKVGLSILNNIGLLSQYEKSLRGTNIAQEQADIRLKTLNKRWEKVGIILKGVIIKIFDKLEPLLSKQGDLFSEYLASFDEEKINSFADGLKGALDVALLLVDAFKFVSSIFKGIGQTAGELIGAVSMGNFSDIIDIKEKFSIGGKLFGLFGGDEDKKTQLASKSGKLQGDLLNTQKSQTDVNVNFNDPKNAVESIKTKSSGNAPGTNVGIAMVTQ